MKNVQWQKKCLGHKHWGNNKFCRVFGEDDTSNHTIKKLGYNKSKHSLKHMSLCTDYNPSYYEPLQWN